MILIFLILLVILSIQIYLFLRKTSINANNALKHLVIYFAIILILNYYALCALLVQRHDFIWTFSINQNVLLNSLKLQSWNLIFANLAHPINRLHIFNSRDFSNHISNLADYVRITSGYKLENNDFDNTKIECCTKMIESLSEMKLTLKKNYTLITERERQIIDKKITSNDTSLDKLRRFVTEPIPSNWREFNDFMENEKKSNLYKKY